MSYALVHRTWSLLRLTYTILCIAVGLDKILMHNFIVNWAQYLSPLVSVHVPLEIAQFLMIIGIVEVIVGLIVWFRPHLGGYLVVLWVAAVIANLASMHAFYDIIARDVVIGVGAIALSWLTKALEN